MGRNTLASLSPPTLNATSPGQTPEEARGQGLPDVPLGYIRGNYDLLTSRPWGSKAQKPLGAWQEGKGPGIQEATDLAQGGADSREV